MTNDTNNTLKKAGKIIFAVLSVLVFAFGLTITMLTNDNKLWMASIPILIIYFLGIHLMLDIPDKLLYWGTYGMFFACGLTASFISLLYQ